MGAPGADAGPSGSGAAYDQELQLERIFHGLSAGFQKLDKLPESKQAALLKDLTAQMQEAKTWVAARGGRAAGAAGGCRWRFCRRLQGCARAWPMRACWQGASTPCGAARPFNAIQCHRPPARLHGTLPTARPPYAAAHPSASHPSTPQLDTRL